MIQVKVDVHYSYYNGIFEADLTAFLPTDQEKLLAILTNTNYSVLDYDLQARIGVLCEKDDIQCRKIYTVFNTSDIEELRKKVSETIHQISKTLSEVYEINTKNYSLVPEDQHLILGILEK